MNTIHESSKRLLGDYSDNKKDNNSYIKMYYLYKALQKDKGTVKNYRYITVIPNYASRLGLYGEYESLNRNLFLFFAYVKYKAGKSTCNTLDEIYKKLKEFSEFE